MSHVTAEQNLKITIGFLETGDGAAVLGGLAGRADHPNALGPAICHMILDPQRVVDVDAIQEVEIDIVAFHTDVGITEGRAIRHRQCCVRSRNENVANKVVVGVGESNAAIARDFHGHLGSAGSTAGNLAGNMQLVAGLVTALGTVAGQLKHAGLGLVQRDRAGVFRCVAIPINRCQGLGVHIVRHAQRTVGGYAIANQDVRRAVVVIPAEDVAGAQGIVVLNFYPPRDVNAGKVVRTAKCQVGATGLDDLVSVASIGNIPIDRNVVILPTTGGAVMPIGRTDGDIPAAELKVEIDCVLKYPIRTVGVFRKRPLDRTCHDDVATVQGKTNLLATVPVIGKIDATEGHARRKVIGVHNACVTLEFQAIARDRHRIPLVPVVRVAPIGGVAIATPRVGVGVNRQGQAKTENRQECKQVRLFHSTLLSIVNVMLVSSLKDVVHLGCVGPSHALYIQMCRLEPPEISGRQ